MISSRPSKDPATDLALVVPLDPPFTIPNAPIKEMSQESPSKVDDWQVGKDAGRGCGWPEDGVWVLWEDCCEATCEMQLRIDQAHLHVSLIISSA